MDLKTNIHAVDARVECERQAEREIERVSEREREREPNASISRSIYNWNKTMTRASLLYHILVSVKLNQSITNSIGFNPLWMVNIIPAYVLAI